MRGFGACINVIYLQIVPTTTVDTRPVSIDPDGPPTLHPSVLVCVSLLLVFIRHRHSLPSEPYKLRLCIRGGT